MVPFIIVILLFLIGATSILISIFFENKTIEYRPPSPLKTKNEYILEEENKNNFFEDLYVDED